MARDDTRDLLNRVLALAEGRDLAADGSVAAARELFGSAEGDDGGELSGELFAAYIGGALTGDELDSIHRALASSPLLRDRIFALVDELEQREQDSIPPEVLAAALASIPSQALSSADLSAFLTGGKALTLDQQRQLFANPALRAEFSRLKQEFTAGTAREVFASKPRRPRYEMPALAAAASEGNLDERRFEGGHALIRKSREGRVMLIHLTLDDITQSPSALWLEGADGEIAYSTLPPASANGAILLIKDAENAADALFVRLLRDPTTVGTFFG